MRERKALTAACRALCELPPLAPPPWVLSVPLKRVLKGWTVGQASKGREWYSERARVGSGTQRTRARGGSGTQRAWPTAHPFQTRNGVHNLKSSPRILSEGPQHAKPLRKGRTGPSAAGTSPQESVQPLSTSAGDQGRAPPVDAEA